MWRAGDVGEASISTFTATETTTEAIDLALAQLHRLHEEGIDEKTLASAKAYLMGQLPYRYETAASIAAAFAQLKFYGIDRSQIDDLFDRIEAVTPADCQRAIDRWFSEDDLRFTAIGVADEIRESLEEYGPVTVRENSDPGFAPTADERSR
jgi:predicted Zn-dependent peptidase